MKKLGIFLMSIIALGLSSCDDFNFQEAVPQTNPQQGLVSYDGLTVAVGSDIAKDVDLSASDSVQVITTTAAPQLSDGQTISYSAYVSAVEDFSEEIQIEVSENGKIATADIDAAFREFIGKTPKQMPLYFRFMAFVQEGTSKVRFGNKDTYFLQGTSVNVTPIPMAFTIESAYYVIGNMNDWNFDNLTKFNHSEKDVYDDPVFSVVFSVDGDCYWKIVPQSTVDAGTKWDGTILGVAVDGDDAMEGKLVSENAQAAKISGNGMYRLTINMEAETYKVEAVGDPYIYLIGTPNGWGINDGKYRLESQDYNDIYTGTFEVPGDCYFRFYKTLGDWNKDSYGAAEADGTNIDAEFVNGTFSSEIVAGKGCWVIKNAGTYRFTVNLVSNTLRIEEATSDPSQWSYIYMVGNINGWSVDAGKEQGALVCTDASNVYKGRLTMPAAAEDNPMSYFRFYTVLSGDWNNGVIGADASADETMEFDEGVAMGALKAGSDKNYIVPAGTYDVVVDLTENVLTLTQVQ